MSGTASPVAAALGSRAVLLVKALFSRKWWWMTLLVLALMAVLARLGVWQLHRLQERRAANAALVAALESAPIDLNQTLDQYRVAAPEQLEQLENRPIEAAGRYDYDHQLTLILQNYEDRPGVDLVTPLVLDDGQTAVLVNRGWVPDADFQAGHLEAYTGSDEPVSVNGYIALTETLRRRTLANPTTPSDQIYRVDVAEIQKDLPYTLLPFYIKDAPPEGGDTQPPLRIPREIDLSEGPHLNYAFQWFIFSIGLGVAYVIFVYRHLSPEPGAAEHADA